MFAFTTVEKRYPDIQQRLLTITYCRVFTSNSLAERRGTRYLSLRLVVL